MRSTLAFVAVLVLVIFSISQFTQGDDHPQTKKAEVPAITFCLQHLQAADVLIERIISHGHASPEGFWYDQGQHEWVVVLKVAARFQFEDGVVEMKPGDFINIPANKKLRGDWTTPDEPDDLAGGVPARCHESSGPGGRHSRFS